MDTVQKPSNSEYKNVTVTCMITMKMHGLCLSALRKTRNWTKSPSSHGGDCFGSSHRVVWQMGTSFLEEQARAIFTIEDLYIDKS
jgi:hypothetical protein